MSKYTGSINIGVSFEVEASSSEEALELVHQWIDRISGTDFSVSVADAQVDFMDIEPADEEEEEGN